MGAYENPLTVIDTESGKIWANAIRGIGEQTVDFLEKQQAELSKQQKEAQITLRENAKYVMQNQAEFSQQMAKNGVNNPYLFQAGKGIIDKMAMVNAEVLAAKTQEESQMALDRYGLLQSSYTNLVAGIKNGADADETYLADISNTKNGPTQQGGMSTSKEGYATYQKIMSIRTGFGKGAVEEYIDNGDGTWNTRFSGGILGEEIIEMPQSEAYSFDPGLIPNVDQEINELITKGSGEDSEGNLIPIIGSNGKYTEEYLMGAEITTTKRNKDGFAVQSVVRAANSAKIISTLTGSVLAKAQNYLKDYDAANSIWLEVFGPEVSKNKPLQRGEDGLGISIEDSKRFSEALLARAKSKLPSFNVETTEIDQNVILSTKITEKAEKNGISESQATRIIAYEDVNALINDPEDFVSRYYQDDDGSFEIIEDDNGGKKIIITDEAQDYKATYDLNDLSNVERFFRNEVNRGMTSAASTKFLKEISAIIRDAKKVRNKSKEDTNKKSEDQVYKEYLNRQNSK